MKFHIGSEKNGFSFLTYFSKFFLPNIMLFSIHYCVWVFTNAKFLTIVCVAPIKDIYYSEQ